jgi:hypothetical protein
MNIMVVFLLLVLTLLVRGAWRLALRFDVSVLAPADFRYWLSGCQMRVRAVSWLLLCVCTVPYLAVTEHGLLPVYSTAIVGVILPLTVIMLTVTLLRYRVMTPAVNL